MRKIESVELFSGLRVTVYPGQISFEGHDSGYNVTHSEFREMVDWAYDQMNKIDQKEAPAYINKEAWPEDRVIALGYEAKPLPTADDLATRSAGGAAAVELLKLGDPNKAYQGVPKEMKLEAVDLAAVARRGAIVESMVKRA